MSSSYNPWLVLFSIGIAFFASYIALDLASRVIHSTGRAMVIWLIGGSFSMGVGIWAMHFIGMLAFHLPIPLAYDIPLTLASIIPAIAASAIALWTVRNGHQNAQTTFVAAIVIGSGISVMHYMGMAALKMQPSIEYTPLLTVLSVMIAIAASLAALKIIFTLNSNPGPKSITLLKAASAALMATAISGMHYTGMAAANFPINGMCRSSPQDLSSGWMAVLIGGGSLMLMLTTLLISIFDARLADQNSRMVKQFKEINSELLSYIKAIGQHAMITVTDKAGCILQANDKFCEISGFSQQALYGHDYRLVNSGTHSSLFFVELWATIVRGDIWRGEICNRAKDGTLYWVDTAIVPLKDSIGEIERYISVTIDITKRKQAEHELTRLGRVLDESSNEIYVFDAQTLHFTMVNAEAQRNLGYAIG
ncbi:MAG: PAS domain S-box-containing protein [Candidatus Nitrotoga sp. SPKER]|nr:MAG: PAS domain S-box-containing protein [Candidatus Nitrotoga sp. SPKER]